MKDYEAAKSYAEIAVKLDSVSVTAWTILGNAALELELADEALSAYRQAIKLDSSDPWLYNYLSQAWQKKTTGMRLLPPAGRRWNKAEEKKPSK